MLRFIRLPALLALAAFLPFAVGCDESDIVDPDRPILVDPDPDPVEPVAVDLDSLAVVFGCDLDLVTIGESFETNLSEATCTLNDGRPVDYFAFGVDEVGFITIDAQSVWFDTVLALYTEDGDLIAENDDTSRFDTNSRVALDLARGVYVATVTSFDGTAWEYRILVTE